MAINIDIESIAKSADGIRYSAYRAGDKPLDIRAFPNAEGLAALTRGAAGYSGTKTVAFVDNLNDSGAGSLRAAIEGAGKEGTFVVFRTSGNINLSSVLETTSDYLTLCFQTSPGGIAVVGAPLRLQDNSNVIIRHGRFRCGSHQPISDTDKESLSIWNADKVMIDKSSMTWGADETVGVTSFGAVAFTNITFSRCLIGAGLTSAAPESNHGYGLLFNGSYATGNTADCHNTLFLTCNSRLPQWSGDTTSNFVNNVVYNFDGSSTAVLDMQGTSQPKVNALSNMTKAGPESNGSIRYGASTAAEFLALGDNAGAQYTVTQSPYVAFYLRRGFGTDRLLDSDAEWSIVDGFSGGYLGEGFKAPVPFSLSEGIPVTETVISESNFSTVRDSVAASSGATVPIRDSVDTDLVNDYTNGTGNLVPDVTYPTDFPTYSTPAYPTDTDGDGIPDSYWTYRGISAQTWSDTAPSGYLWIEDYVNDLADGSFSL